MSRAAIYARYSSDLQKATSIEDQIRVLKERAEKEGWRVMNCYTDHALSGSSMHRPGVEALLRDARDGKFEIILAEALDRLSRDQADTASIFKQMQFHGVKIVTLSENEVGLTDVGLKGLVNQLYIVEMRQKVKRGQRGRTEAGKVTAGLAYGYDVVRKFDAQGNPVRGERKLNETQAPIVRRIFEEYAAGRSPRMIANGLNEDGIASPKGGKWNPSTIHGHRNIGNGILNNTMYIGLLTWNRTQELRDPITNARVIRHNDESEYVTGEAPELRIVDQDIWDSVKARQDELDKKKRPEQKRRPKYLLSGLIKCGVCGSGYNKLSHGRYGCFANRNKRCSNNRTVYQDDLERLVIESLRSRLMEPELLEVFCEEYTKHVNSLRMNHNAELNAKKAELKKLEKAKRRCLDAILAGIPGDEVKDEMISIRDRRIQIEEYLASVDEEPVLLHPTMSQHYFKQVRGLSGVLRRQRSVDSTSEAIRSLIEKIIVLPDDAGEGVQIDLHGDLANILSLAETAKTQPSQRRVANSELTMVGPEGLEPPTKPL